MTVRVISCHCHHQAVFGLWGGGEKGWRGCSQVGYGKSGPGHTAHAHLMEAADIAEAADGWWLCQLEMQHPGVAIVDVEQQGNNLLDLAGHAMHQGSAEPLMH